MKKSSKAPRYFIRIKYKSGRIEEWINLSGAELTNKRRDAIALDHAGVIDSYESGQVH